MTALESQLLFARAVLLILLYAFLGAVLLVAWRELRQTRRQPAAPRREPGTRLIVIDGGRSDRAPGSAFPTAPVTTLGRDIDNDVVLADPTISGRHAVVNRRDGAWWIEDLGSTNGTFVAGARAEAASPVVLRSGDEIQLGAVRLRLVTSELGA